MQEIWKPIPNFPNYEASSLGRVRSVVRVVPHWRGGVRNMPEKILAGIEHRGYLVVKLGGPNKAYGVHQCVMAAFHGWRPSMVVNHINADKTDSRIENLEYVTNSQNVHHAYKHGLMRVAGEDNGLRKIDTATAIAILQADRAKDTKQVAAELNCSVNIVRQVRAGKTWRHVVAVVAALLLMIGTLPAQVLIVSTTPTLAPSNCPCVSCKCDPCKCVKPVVSVMKLIPSGNCPDGTCNQKPNTPAPPLANGNAPIEPVFSGCSSCSGSRSYSQPVRRILFRRWR